MRIAIVSDIHGSLHALRRVVIDLKREAPDVVLHGGDLAVNGPYPDEVVALIREMEWRGVVGNTDEMLWRIDELPHQVRQMPRLETLLRVLYEHTGPATLDRLGDDNLAWLRGLPQTLTIGDITLLHAAPSNLWRAPPPDADDEAFEQTYREIPSNVVVYGHIHRPFVRVIDGLTVANSGSVGLTWDRDARASYVLIDEAGPTVKRVEYDVDADVRGLFERKLPYADWLAEMRRRGRFIAPDAFRR